MFSRKKKSKSFTIKEQQISGLEIEIQGETLRLEYSCRSDLLSPSINLIHHDAFRPSRLSSTYDIISFSTRELRELKQMLEKLEELLYLETIND